MIYTDIKQSKRLIELGLDPNRADLQYNARSEVVITPVIREEEHIPRYSDDELRSILVENDIDFDYSYSMTRGDIFVELTLFFSDGMVKYCNSFFEAIEYCLLNSYIQKF